MGAENRLIPAPFTYQIRIIFKLSKHYFSRENTMTSASFQSENVDPSEIAKFEALASRWWDRNSEFKPLHDINPLRMGFIDEQLNLAGRKVLDVGCGGGILTEAMAHRGAEVSGIDMGEAPLAVAKLHLLESNLVVDYQQASAEDYARSRQSAYSVITCLEMLEHVPDPA
ncbi:MAG: 2-polyprenyl-6-hydroxyphenyl methylase/3-demethylubiquinone-9 3-methyltransferase, partial [Pseudohongiellaceae bacterium]